MSRISNLSIRTRVIAAFATVLFVTVGLGLFAKARIGEVNEEAVDIRNNWLPAGR